MENIKEYVDRCVAFGKPVQYCGLDVQPIKVKDFYLFQNAQDVLKINKNKIPDIEIIQMTYLKFLALMMCESVEMREDFLTLLALTLGLKYDATSRNMDFPPNEMLAQQLRHNETMLNINGWDVSFKIGDNQSSMILYRNDDKIEINDEQFDELCHIWLYQNIYDYDDMEMSDDFRKVVEDYYRLKNKDILIPTLEDRMLAVVVSSSYTLEQLYELPLRLFDALFEYSVSKLDYEINKLID